MDTVKSALSLEGGHLIRIRELNIENNWRKHTGKSTLSNKDHLKAVNFIPTSIMKSVTTVKPPNSGHIGASNSVRC